ncbi:hypothetical protein SD53_10635 [Rheinheimera mesophila]|nr:hypothetical protein SD53_10635 [Rheinheimera mesophila]
MNSEKKEGEPPGFPSQKSRTIQRVKASILSQVSQAAVVLQLQITGIETGSALNWVLVCGPSVAYL